MSGIFFDDMELIIIIIFYASMYHSSERRGLLSLKCSTETIQNFMLDLMYKKTHINLFVFHFMQLYFFIYVYVYREEVKLHEMKN